MSGCRVREIKIQWGSQYYFLVWEDFFFELGETAMTAAPVRWVKFKEERGGGQGQHAQRYVIRLAGGAVNVEMHRQIGHQGEGHVMHHFVSHAGSLAHGERLEMGGFAEFPGLIVKKSLGLILVGRVIGPKVRGHVEIVVIDKDHRILGHVVALKKGQEMIGMQKPCLLISPSMVESWVA